MWLPPEQLEAGETTFGTDCRHGVDEAESFDACYDLISKILSFEAEVDAVVDLGGAAELLDKLMTEANDFDCHLAELQRQDPSRLRVLMISNSGFALCCCLNFDSFMTIALLAGAFRG